MHDASIPTLADVIKPYEAGGRTVEAGPHKGVDSASPLESEFVAGPGAGREEEDMTMRAPAAVIALLLTLTAGAAAAAQPPTPKQQAADMAAQLMSPFCPGRLLADCTSPDAAVLRKDIAARIAAGETAAAVKADLVRQYGAEILGAPEATGVGWLAWLVPGILGLASFVAMGVKVVRATRHAPAPALAAAGVTDAQVLTQLDDELRDLD